jgi:hypothetical protein
MPNRLEIVGTRYGLVVVHISDSLNNLHKFKRIKIMMKKINKDSLMISLFMFGFFSLFIYSFITNNFLAKTFIVGIQVITTLSILVVEKLFL